MCEQTTPSWPKRRENPSAEESWRWWIGQSSPEGFHDLLYLHFLLSTYLREFGAALITGGSWNTKILQAPLLSQCKGFLGASPGEKSWSTSECGDIHLRITADCSDESELHEQTWDQSAVYAGWILINSPTILLGGSGRDGEVFWSMMSVIAPQLEPEGNFCRRVKPKLLL